MFCHLCGIENKKELPWGRRSQFGSFSFRHDEVYCDSCRSKINRNITPKVKNVFCVLCNEKMYFKNRRPVAWICDDCASNFRPPKYHAAIMMQKYPEKIKILRECPHKNKKRDRHHPDYSKPFEVELLCRPCHYVANKKMGLYKKEYVLDFQI